ncbi:response regulator transcription factor [Phragmitibacter flavus]|uniref:Response regulator transcription factor n=1 Tax=Phragmitibacter flavus TaxID=2576071 RepID=A0A5R8KFI6_9BACT|nr:response regulator transcription factor [Phragmitibacter flavus]TLD71058.1 response regulator transcription factor [Phragmitibacter flavus]
MGISPNSDSRSNQLRFLVVDDHPLFRRGVALIVKNQPGFQVVGEAESFSSALDKAREVRPDFLITDITMPGPNGIELIKSILAEFPHLLILVISMHDEAEYPLKVIRAGAKGYVLKDEALDALPEALQKICSSGIYLSSRFNNTLIWKAVEANGGTEFRSFFSPLSEREMEVFELIGNQVSAHEIAGRLSLSVKTVENHRAHIKEKLGVQTASELTQLASQWIAACEPR